MPVVHITYDPQIVSEPDARSLCEATRTIIQEVTGIEDVVVYGSAPIIQVGQSPLEIFMQMSASKIQSLDLLMATIKDRLAKWKNEAAFAHPINLTIDPMPWKFAIGI